MLGNSFNTWAQIPIVSGMKILLSRLRYPLSLRTWTLIALLTVILRSVLVFLLVPVGAAAPDEFTYAALLAGLRLGIPLSDLSVSVGVIPLVITNSWPLTLPALPITFLGFSESSALRIVSSLYAAAAAVTLLITVFLIRNQVLTGGSKSVIRMKGFGILSFPGVAVLVFLLMPSSSLWSSFALRDAASVFGSVLFVLAIYVVLSARSLHVLALGVPLAFLGALQVLLTRSYLAPLLAIATGVAVLSCWRLSGPRSKLVALYVVGVILTVGPVVRGGLEGLAEPIASAEQPAGGPNAAEEAMASDPVNAVTGVVDSRVSRFAQSRNGFMLGARSAYPWNYCTEFTNTLKSLPCELFHLPVGVSRFLFEPLAAPWGTLPSGPLLFASFENYIWVIFFIAFVASLLLRQSRDLRMSVLVASFIVLGVIGYALISGNFGTAFRHKSQFLWAFTLIVGISADWRPWVARLKHVLQ